MTTDAQSDPDLRHGIPGCWTHPVPRAGFLWCEARNCNYRLSESELVVVDPLSAHTPGFGDTRGAEEVLAAYELEALVAGWPM